MQAILMKLFDIQIYRNVTVVMSGLSVEGIRDNSNNKHVVCVSCL